MVTNPYHYMKKHFDLREGEKSYSQEISIIGSKNYNKFFKLEYLKEAFQIQDMRKKIIINLQDIGYQDNYE